MSQVELLAPGPKIAAPASSIDGTDLKRVGLVTALMVAGALVAVAVLAFLLRSPLSHLAVHVAGALGLPGIFGSVLFADATMFPLPPDVFLFTAVAGSLNPLVVLAVVSGASILAGSVAWLLGPLLGRIPILGPRVERYRPQGEAFFERYGVWAVAIAALTPLPYSAFAWLAGTYRLPWQRLVIATLFRIPRFLFYLLLFRIGWLA